MIHLPAERMIDLFGAVRAERVIIRQIEELTMERIAFRKSDLEKDIKYYYYQGTFSQKRYDKLMKLLQDRYNELYDVWIQKLEESYERDYQSKMIRYARGESFSG